MYDFYYLVRTIKNLKVKFLGSHLFHFFVILFRLIKNIIKKKNQNG